MNAKNATKAKKVKPKKTAVKEDDDIMKIVREQQRRGDLQARGLPSQGGPTNDAPVVSNGAREAEAMQANQRGFYNIPDNMLPQPSKDD